MKQQTGARIEQSVQRIRLQDGQPGINFGRSKHFALRYSLQIGSGAHRTCYSMDTGGPFPREYNCWVVKLTTHLHLMQRSRMVELYIHSPIRLYASCLIN
jgi:hypothetical protein